MSGTRVALRAGTSVSFSHNVSSATLGRKGPKASSTECQMFFVALTGERITVALTADCAQQGHYGRPWLFHGRSQRNGALKPFLLYEMTQA